MELASIPSSARRSANRDEEYLPHRRNKFNIPAAALLEFHRRRSCEKLDQCRDPAVARDFLHNRAQANEASVDDSQLSYHRKLS
jgi:hypothetical protein